MQGKNVLPRLLPLATYGKCESWSLGHVSGIEGPAPHLGKTVELALEVWTQVRHPDGMRTRELIPPTSAPVL